MVLIYLNNEFSICKISSLDSVDMTKDYTFLAKTDDELSIVCDTGNVPDNVLIRDDGWKSLKIEGVLDFSLTGVIAGISAIIAEKHLGIFVVSTFNTDYIFMKKEQVQAGINLLRQNGYEVKIMES